MASKKTVSNDKIDAVLAAVVGAVDYDQAKQLDEATAEEPDEAEHNRMWIRRAFREALAKNKLELVSIK